MKRLICITAMVWVLAGSGALARAQVDASTPKAALKSLYAAIEAGDAGGIGQVLLVVDDPGQELAKSYAQWILCGKQLGDAVRAKFPGSPNELAQGTISMEDAARVDGAAVDIKDDTATLKITGRPNAVSLKQVNGQWRVLVGEGATSSPENRAARLALLKGLIDAMNKSIEEIKAEKYVTIQDAEAALKDRLGAVMTKAMQENPPTSRPTTQP